jgi:hypothetical protein
MISLAPGLKLEKCASEGTEGMPRASAGIGVSKTLQALNLRRNTGVVYRRSEFPLPRFKKAGRAGLWAGASANKFQRPRAS